ncbi:hypothetical protein B0J11DRAFT_517009 [Dendryphion nanum]|uniref:Uncharacterized protein n=1 Tax=Dendryphion nanum TaxID=256645 RepID=A0A9P9EJW8_9PLEO|nr:hypothetical protein B0J11DRAFT_517009 [Dendryphion nanum]
MVPTYEFPGTWSRAAEDSSRAAKSVASASVSYYRAVTASGISTASMSVGGALASTVNRGALNAAYYAVQSAGTDRSRLPRFVNHWLEKKDDVDVAKIRAKEAEEERTRRKFEQGVNNQQESSRGSSRHRGSTVTDRRSRIDSTPDSLRSIPIERFREDNVARGLIPPCNTDMCYVNSGYHKKEQDNEEGFIGQTLRGVSLKPPLKNSGGSEGHVEASVVSSSRNITHNPSNASLTPSPLRNVRGRHVEYESDARGSTIEEHLRTPTHAARMFNNLETPAEVRRQLNEPLEIINQIRHSRVVEEAQEPVEEDGNEDESGLFVVDLGSEDNSD